MVYYVDFRGQENALYTPKINDIADDRLKTRVGNPLAQHEVFYLVTGKSDNLSGPGVKTAPDNLSTKRAGATENQDNFSRNKSVHH
jgi:hypothetical protein